MPGPPVIERGDEFGREMLRVASRAAIPAEHELAAVTKACDDHFGRLHHRLAAVRGGLQLHLGRGRKKGVDIGRTEA